MEIDFDVRKLPEYLEFDTMHIAKAKARQKAFWAGEKIDYPLYFIGGTLTPEQETIPNPNYQELYNSPELMLCSEIRQACAFANGKSDAVPSIRVNMGCGITMSCLGLAQETFPDKMPWLKEHMNKEQISRLTPDDIKIQGDFARGLEIIHFYKEIMGDSIAIFVMDTQGPFDLAHLLMGDDLFLELYDDPAFVHHLMNLMLELGTKTIRWMKDAIGEPCTSCYYDKSIYSENYGIRICEDTTTLLGDAQIREFAVPYSQKLAQRFGGAFCHYCGRNDLLTMAQLEIPEFKTINFGLIPGKLYDHDFYQEMERVEKAVKVYRGWWPVLPDESYHDYLKRMHYFAVKGIQTPCLEMDSAGKFKTVEEIGEYWKSL
jgi:hypothetical protein